MRILWKMQGYQENSWYKHIIYIKFIVYMGSGIFTQQPLPECYRKKFAGDPCDLHYMQLGLALVFEISCELPVVVLLLFNVVLRMFSLSEAHENSTLLGLKGLGYAVQPRKSTNIVL